MLRPILPWLCVSLLAAACSGGGSDRLGESLGSGDGDGGDEDAAVESPEDAGEAPTVADPPDAAAPAPDAGVGDDAGDTSGVRVRVRSVSGPARALVLLHDEEGAALSEALPTSAQGEVFTELAPSMVTVVLEDERAGPLYRIVELITYTGVEAGDVLTVEVPPAYADARGSYLVTLPAPYPGGGGAIDVTSGSSYCATGSAGDQEPVEVFVSCQLPGDAYTLLASLSDEAGAAWFTWGADLPAPAQGTQSAATFSQAWTRGDALTIALEGVAPSEAINAWSQVSMLRGTQRFSASSLGTSSLLSGGVAYTVVSDFAGEVESSVWYTALSGPTTPRIAAIAKRSPTSSSAVVFGTDEFLDVPRGISVEQGDDPLRPTLRFSGPRAPAGVDALIASATLAWYEGDTSTSLTWRAILPANTTSLTLPALPPSFIYDSGPGAQNQVRVGIASVGDDRANDYAGYRARPFRVAYDQEYDDIPVRVDATHCAEHKLTAYIEPVGT